MNLGKVNNERIFFFLLGFVFFFPVIIKGQQMKLIEYTRFVPKTVNNWTSVDNGQVYDHQSIYDYMNGAAEIYKQYTFAGLYVRLYENPGKPAITLEIFDMGISKDAFGIFSHVRDGKEIGIGQGSDDTGGAINFWKGKYFVYIHTEDEIPESRIAMIELANLIDREMRQTGVKPDILKFLPPAGLVENEIRYTRSFILLNMHYFIASENILNISSETEAVLASYLKNDKESYLLLVCYPSEKQAASAQKNFIQNYLPETPESNTLQTEEGKWIGVSKENEFLILVFDAPTEAHAKEMLTSIQIH